MSEQRLAELEIKMSYQEDALSALNDVIYQQQTRIDGLEALLSQYRQHIDGMTSEAPGYLSTEQKPPHY